MCAQDILGKLKNNIIIIVIANFFRGCFLDLFFYVNLTKAGKAI